MTIKMTEDMMTELLIQKDEYEVSFGKTFNGINEEFINHMLETKDLMRLQPDQMDLLMNSLQKMNRQELEKLTSVLKNFQDKMEKECDDDEDYFYYEFINAMTLYNSIGNEFVGITPHFLEWMQSNVSYVKSFSLRIVDYLYTTEKFDKFQDEIKKWMREKGEIGIRKYAEVIASDMKKIRAAHAKSKRGFGN